MPKIAVVTSEFPIRDEPYRGSPVYQTVLALQRLAEVEIEVFCLVSTYPRWRLLHPRKFYFRRPDPGYSPPNVRVRYIEYPAFPLLSRPINGHTITHRLQRYLENIRPDLVLSYWIYPDGYGALLAAEKLGVPGIVGSRGFDLSRIPDPFTRHLVKKTLKKASFTLTVSEELRQRAILLGAPPERTRTIHNGCDPEVFHLSDRSSARSDLGVRADSHLVLYVGRVDRLKGVQELLDAVARLVPNDPHLEVAFIGEGPMVEILRKECSQQGFGDHVRFLGVRTPAETSRWIAASNLLCLPSYSEGCPNVIIEALSCGRAVVASDVGGIPELVNSSCGILVPPRDAAQLAEALQEALHKLWDESGIASRFSRTWDDVAAETYNICKSLIEKRTPAETHRSLESSSGTLVGRK